jgi:hypothetical protein
MTLLLAYSLKEFEAPLTRKQTWEPNFHCGFSLIVE